MCYIALYELSIISGFTLKRIQVLYKLGISLV